MVAAEGQGGVELLRLVGCRGREKEGRWVCVVLKYMLTGGPGKNK